MIDQAEKLRMLARRKETRIITVASGKGGVGKSNFIVNLGISLKEKGKKILIFDADIGMGNVDVLMGVYSRKNIFDVIDGENIEDVIEDGTLGVKFLSAGSRVQSMNEITNEEREEFLKKLNLVDHFDFILIDIGAGVNKTSLEFIRAAEELIVLTTPEPTALTDAYSLLKVGEHFNVKNKIKIIINRVESDKEGLVIYSKFKTVVMRFLNLNIEYLGCIYEDKKLLESVKIQKPVLVNYPNSKVSKNIEEISCRILREEYVGKEKGKNIFSRIFNMFS
ncbi:MAG: MinD/ParA family protein [Clostridium sp.]